MSQISCVPLIGMLLFYGVLVDGYYPTLYDNYYASSCKDAESVIQQTVSAELDKDLKQGAGLIRMQYHDCFVEGCDASILLDGPDAEKTADVNAHLKGFDVIDAAKSAVEAICPGVVSCADIIAYAARDSTVKLNGSSWVVQGGRKDGIVSSAANAEANIPPPTFEVTQLIDAFVQRGLTAWQMVVLSGSHTVGVGHCDKIVSRLYNFDSTDFTDPTIDPTYAEQLKADCPQFTFNTTIEVFMDVLTPGEFDSGYFDTLEQSKGLFTSDQSLYLDSRTKSSVEALKDEAKFEDEFAKAMIALGTVGVKTQGQVRTNCRVVNS
ncbi:peroxidase [Marchantia polymorpha subsp. ruderalis]|uniref:Peroxidase n=2 Tax=Marchantia polymorpha TaxID=3197 RepID=A0A176VKJ0_MARPO|nr:hypothetical protein AXG93_4698s1150 [Marchantia polymorpha subsp. ruderalis]PTQ33567.1 hypothetical protein MARPO_0087s0010 [Marchantia polymorpha]BBN07706.1 hypothetical protein Mp_4g05810 [Marchantia polymorpha subsp. ruderalis]|eukprot:PTQ33567.1 hypothetical protein MARPO_0087s0010 [Marchantia polymorpha]